jgi:hypothetical protein
LRKHEPITELDDVNKIHNRIVEQQQLRGCGIGSIEEEVHEIRAGCVATFRAAGW